MTQEHDEQAAAERLFELFQRVLQRAQIEYELSSAAISTALIGAGVRAALDDMPSTEAVAGWLHDIADAIEAGVEPDDLLPAVH